MNASNNPIITVPTYKYISVIGINPINADIIKPDKGVLMTQNVAVTGGSVSLKMPAFVDDIAVHIYDN